jgi:subtilisin family serine protease
MKIYAVLMGITVWAGLGLGQDVPKRIASASDLPTFSYSASVSAMELVRSTQTFQPIAVELRRDIESLLRDYTIEDRATMHGLHETLLNLDMLEKREADARREIATIRSLQDKPGAKLTEGLFEEAILAAGIEKPESRMFFRVLSGLLEPLPWNLVENDIKQERSGIETMGESLLLGIVETEYGPAIQKTGRFDLAAAQQLASIRYALTFTLPLKDQADEVLTSYIAAHYQPKADIWETRSLTLDPKTQLKPVAIGIWDTGVDRSLFRTQLETSGAVPGFDFYGNATQSPMVVLDSNQKQEWPQTKAMLKGFLDLQASVDSPEASAIRKKIADLKPEQTHALLEAMALASNYVHGTHVAGIALSGNPFGRILPARYGFPYQIPPPAPTLEGIRRFAAGAGQLTAYFQKHNARVVNMSWGDNLKEFESMLQQNGVGADASERRKMAQQMLEAERDGLRKALTSTPEILYVAAGGNSGSNSAFDEDIWASLRLLPNLFIAGAVDQAGNEAPFTNFGPAIAVYSNGYEVESFIPGGERLKLSGTSMAAPNVTNLAAKLIALDRLLKPAEVIRLIKDGSDPSPDGRFHLINPKRSAELLRSRTTAARTRIRRF